MIAVSNRLTCVANRRDMLLKACFKKSVSLTIAFKHLHRVVNERHSRLFTIRSKAQKAVNESTFQKSALGMV